MNQDDNTPTADRPPQTRSGRGGYRIRYAQDDLHFRELRLRDPVPLGRQILDAAGVDPRDGFSLLAILPSGDFEDVRLDEKVDLRARGKERFIAFQTDRLFKMTLDERQVDWGKPFVSGRALAQLAALDEKTSVFLEVRGGTDRLLGAKDLVDLREPGIERFITAPSPSPKLEIIVNARSRLIDVRQLTYEALVQLAFPDVPPQSATFSVTYRMKGCVPVAGELGAGGTVDVQQGMIFNVTRTVKS